MTSAKKVAWKQVSSFNGPEESPGFLLWQVSTEWRRQIELALSPIGLTHVQFVLLASVAWLTREGASVTQIELARHCKTDSTMTSQVLRTLERKGYVERRQSADDERAKRPFVTPSGSKCIEKALPLVEAVDRHFFGASKQVVYMLQKILKNELKRFSLPAI